MGRARAESAEKTKPEQLLWSMDEQRDAVRYGPAPLCLNGGFGASKTYTAFLKIMILCQLYPGTKGIVLRGTEKDLIHTTLPTMFKLFKPACWRYSGRLNMDERYMKLNNGSEILWWYTKGAANDLSILRGLEINWFFINQAEDFSEEVFDVLDGRLGRWDGATVDARLVENYEATHKRPWPWKHRVSGKPRPPSYAIVDVNPAEDLDHWVYRRFHPESEEHSDPIVWDREHNDFFSYREKGYKMITFDSRNNRFLSEDNLNKLMSKGKEFTDRFVEGKWGTGEGQIHRVDDLSLVPGTPELVEKLLKRCTLSRILDHGDSSPTCCGWMAADPEGNIYFYREHYKADHSISVHRQTIYDGSMQDAAMLDSSGGRLKLPNYRDLADPSIFGSIVNRKAGRKFVSDEYDDDEYGAETSIRWEPADNDELGTRNRINEYLRVDPKRVHPFTGELGSPRLFFITRTADWPMGCHKLVIETKKQRKLKIDVVNGRPVFTDERDPKVVDHGHDVVRYGVADRPVAEQERKKNPDDWTHEDIIARFRRVSTASPHRRGGKRAVLRRVG